MLRFVAKNLDDRAECRQEGGPSQNKRYGMAQQHCSCGCPINIIMIDPTFLCQRKLFPPALEESNASPQP
jgi:hypothetical protein